MNVFKTNQKLSDLDVLYRVDPRRLSITSCSASISDEGVASECTTTFECFYLEDVVAKPEVPAQLEELPAFIDGVFYFGTEEEAQDFIRLQIGI